MASDDLGFLFGIEAEYMLAEATTCRLLNLYTSIDNVPFRHLQLSLSITTR